MPTSHPLRLDRGLVKAAAREGEIFKRSIPRQIEYWAELGRAIAGQCDPLDLIKVREGLARLTIEPVKTTAVSSDTVFFDLEHARTNGELVGMVSATGPRYQASAANPGFLEQINPDGTRVVGKFSSGRFITRD